MENAEQSKQKMNKKPTLQELIEAFKRINDMNKVDWKELDWEARYSMKRVIETLGKEPIHIPLYHLEKLHTLLSENVDYNEEVAGFSAGIIENYLNNCYWIEIRDHAGKDEKVEAGLIFGRMAEKIGNIIHSVDSVLIKGIIEIAKECIPEAIEKHPDNLGLYLAKAYMLELENFPITSEKTEEILVINKSLSGITCEKVY